MSDRSVWLLAWLVICLFGIAWAQHEAASDSGEFHMTFPFHDYDYEETRRADPRVVAPEHVDIVEVRHTHEDPLARGFWKTSSEDIPDDRRILDYDISRGDLLSWLPPPRRTTPTRSRRLMHNPSLTIRSRNRRPVLHQTSRRLDMQSNLERDIKANFLAKVEKFRKELFHEVMRLIKEPNPNKMANDRSADVPNYPSPSNTPRTVSLRIGPDEKEGTLINGTASVLPNVQRSLSEKERLRKVEEDTLSNGTGAVKPLRPSPTKILSNTSASAQPAGDSRKNETSHTREPMPEHFRETEIRKPASEDEGMKTTHLISSTDTSSRHLNKTSSSRSPSLTTRKYLNERLNGSKSEYVESTTRKGESIPPIPERRSTSDCIGCSISPPVCPPCSHS